VRTAANKTVRPAVAKDASMRIQKNMMGAHYDRMTAAPETGEKICSTFVPGNLNELIMCFDMVKQLKEEVIPTLEQVSGVKFDIDRLREYLKRSAVAEDDLVWVLQSARNKPSPIDAYFGGIPRRIDMLTTYLEEYQADGLLINSIKSCNSFAAGQLLMMREVEKRTGKAAALIETDLVDPRYFAASNIKNRIESYFQMIDQKRAGDRGLAA
jgi:hypothetical protein